MRDSGGFAIAVPDDEIAAAQLRVPDREGQLLCPEGAATFAAYVRALDQNLVGKDDRVVLFNCGNGLKYPMPPADAAIDRHQPIDWDALAGP